MGSLQLVPTAPVHAHPKEKQNLSSFLLLTPISSHFSLPWRMFGRDLGRGRLRGPTIHPIHMYLL